ncbi:MAG: aminotransferase class I/II-fold pyridoxal phosphate-dependent enzyme [Nitrospirae bacterium]|nr:aminotransferase class I/II-fold pyridoxal phosphate-dependent enzyme [Nitrospirota bacterium]MBI3604726.1 aminotransferase class I/II-fold pyridoxal phosphate-dependent enzyme [Nitrospirota bacterium]
MMLSENTIFYERRKQTLPINLKERRMAEQRQNETAISNERRRLAEQIRNYEREQFKIPVCLRLDKKEIFGYTHDISPNGLLVFCDVNLNAGTALSLRFNFAQACNIKIAAVVISSRENAIRLKFSEIKDKDWEQKILSFAIQEFKQSSIIQKQSLLNILFSKEPLTEKDINLLDQSSRIHEKPSMGNYKAIEDTGELRDVNLLTQNESFHDSIKRTNETLHKWAERHTYARVVDSGCGPRITLKGKKLIMLSSNDHLGLASDPRVKEAAIKAIEKYGTGAGSPNVLGGTFDLHKRLEERLAKFKSMEDAILFSTGFMANVGAISTLFREDFVLLNDAKNHISLFEGCRASKSRVRVYRHNDMEHLEKLLNVYAIYKKIIITDSVFSMDGDLANLSEICKLAKRYNAVLLVDDVFGSGVLGVNGKGSLSHFQIEGQVDIVTDSFGKALASIGGYVAGSKETINYLRYFSMMSLFTTSLTPVICATVLAALDVLESDKELIPKLWFNIKYLRSGLLKMGFNLGTSTTQIIPVIIGDEALAHQVAGAMQERGVFVGAIGRPAVKRGEARLRLAPIATNSIEDLDIALTVFKDIGERFNLTN